MRYFGVKLLLTPSTHIAQRPICMQTAMWAQEAIRGWACEVWPHDKYWLRCVSNNSTEKENKRLKSVVVVPEIDFVR